MNVSGLGGIFATRSLDAMGARRTNCQGACPRGLVSNPRPRAFLAFFSKACKARALPLRHEPTFFLNQVFLAVCFSQREKRNLQDLVKKPIRFLANSLLLLHVGSMQPIGGDLAAGSPTATLLRLNPPHQPLARLSLCSGSLTKS